ncbi:gliding motility-associated C-terminal domain-containing protein [Fulvivirgaceae bacterium PWU4]|uniref:Gliding motility-associated C-terminal domain-containing protein n=1 Tax=Chryseosolibacter histidini TaxID=2782349 RepID=A0AAP2DMB9_9BACT|nr:gliding motility-associated C-terminal domain-containing protein [Chryseosolibacter histidini]MBT1697903.1 gliding motility-associated C-terminal domain-containing protein [Chryseosolibacter histidini]
MRTVITMLSLVATFFVQAQSLHNSSVISITAGSVLFVRDSLVNNGTIVNNGDMQIGGAWINKNQYDAGQGQITFNSSLPQVINHNDQSFSKLTISGGGEKIFQANITIENELNLSEGILVSANNASIIFNSGAAVTGGSDQAHIVGTVYHQGTGSKTFPLGNGTLYLPVTLTNIEGSSAEVGISGYELNGTTLRYTEPLNAVSRSRYWKIDLVSGSLATAKIILPLRDEDIVTNLEKAVVTQSDGVASPFRSLGKTSSPSNDFITSSGAVMLPFVAIGTVEDDGSIFVYNAVSPNSTDHLNSFLRIENIERFPSNKVRIFNRWGDKVFEMTGYDNQQHIFTGKKNIGGEEDLPEGTYYYEVDRNNGAALVNGYLSLKR